jgi:hypothetical protein
MLRNVVSQKLTDVSEVLTASIIREIALRDYTAQHARRQSSSYSPQWKPEISQAVSRSASQKIPRILWNPNVHYRVHKSLKLDHILSHMNPVHTLISYVFIVHFNIILASQSVFQVISIQIFFRLKFFRYILSLTWVSASPVSPFLIWKPKEYFLKVTNYEAFRYDLFLIYVIRSFGRDKELRNIKTVRSRIWGSHGGEYEDGCLLGCSAV